MWNWLFGFWCAASGLCEQELRACRELDHAGVPHVVCSYDVADIEIGLYNFDAKGSAFGRLSRLKSTLDRQPRLLMNGGMYHEDLKPVGLYVESGEQSTALSTKPGWGNFHLLPNGVFWSDGGKLGVTETKAFAKAGRKVEFATQSGPMLVIDGKLHPRFIRDSDSLKIRNGVGVSKDGQRIHFAISKRIINFWDFGTLFRDELDAHNALFLDGTVSAIDAEGFTQSSWKSIGPIIAVFDRK